MYSNCHNVWSNCLKQWYQMAVKQCLHYNVRIEQVHGDLLTNIFIRPKSDHCLALSDPSLSHSVPAQVEMMWPWRVKIRLTSPKVRCCWRWNKTKDMLLMPKQNKRCCWCRNKTKAMLLMLKQNKNHVVDTGTKQKLYCWCQNKTKAILLMAKKQKPFVMVSKKGSDRLDPFKKNFCHRNFLLETSPIIAFSVLESVSPLVELSWVATNC